MSAEPTPVSSYAPQRASVSLFPTVRGIRTHVRKWVGNHVGSGLPPLVMLHGFMDVAASFQFVIDALSPHRTVFAFDWRGFGLTEAPKVDSYWFADYLGDLDGVLDALGLDHGIKGPVDLLGHSMGGNIAMFYAGLRPERICRLINLEGFGLPDSAASEAPLRYRKWLDQLKTPKRLRGYANIGEVAARLQENNRRLPIDKALWLAAHWSRKADDGNWHLLLDPAHKRVNPVLYREAEASECRRLIVAPTLWVEGAQSTLLKIYGGRLSRAELDSRLAMLPQLERDVIDDCGHMLHHDQPQQLAARMDQFLG